MSALEVRDAPPRSGTPCPLGVPRDHEVLGAVEGLELEVGAERRLRERDRQVARRSKPSRVKRSWALARTCT